MKNGSYVTAAELAQMADVSVGHAYKVIHSLNDELNKKGFVTFAGKVPRKYLEERCYGIFGKGEVS